MRGIGVWESGNNEILALEVLNVIACVEWSRRAELPASAYASRAVAAAPSDGRSRRAGVRAWVHLRVLKRSSVTRPSFQLRWLEHCT